MSSSATPFRAATQEQVAGTTGWQAIRNRERFARMPVAEMCQDAWHLGVDDGEGIPVPITRGAPVSKRPHQSIAGPAPNIHGDPIGVRRRRGGNRLEDISAQRAACHEPGFLVVVAAGDVRKYELEPVDGSFIGEELRKNGMTAVAAVSGSRFDQEPWFGVAGARIHHRGRIEMDRRREPGRARDRRRCGGLAAWRRRVDEALRQCPACNGFRRAPAEMGSWQCRDQEGPMRACREGTSQIQARKDGGTAPVRRGQRSDYAALDARRRPLRRGLTGDGPRRERRDHHRDHRGAASRATLRQGRLAQRS